MLGPAELRSLPTSRVNSIDWSTMLTTPPSQLWDVQRIPHFDSVDEDFIALLHYVTNCEGTAYYRHRQTGLEIMTTDTVDQYVAAARECTARATADYIRESSDDFEQIGMVSGAARRMIAYPGKLLHSEGAGGLQVLPAAQIPAWGD